MLARLLKLLGISVLALACNGDTDDRWTWGEFSRELAGAYCAATVRCGLFADAELCVDHVAWHLCAPHYSCDLPLADEDAAREALDACVADLEAVDASGCEALYWGILPESCYGLTDFEPSSEADAGPDAG